MKKILLLAASLVLVLACTLPTPTPVAPTALPGGSASQAAPGTTPDGAAPTQPVDGGGTLPLLVLSPLDGEVVNTPQVEIIGSAAAGSVLSVNDEILIVGADGQFKVIVMLEEGPNLIEIVASDGLGNTAYLPLSIFYEP